MNPFNNASTGSEFLSAGPWDISGDVPGPGTRLYYLLRMLDCGSWQTTVGAEPDRDTALQ